MHTRPRFVTAPLGLTVLVGLVLVALAGMAWACTPKPEAFALDTMQAAPGEQINATGSAPGSITKPVQLRWNGVDGPVLARATPAIGHGGEFSATFQVPEQAEAGVAYVVASAQEANAGVARAAVEITGGEQATTATDSPWQVTQQQPTTTADASGLTPDGASAPLVAGAGLLSLGLVGLFAGATVATVQTRRSPAYAHAPMPSSRRHG